MDSTAASRLHARIRKALERERLAPAQRRGEIIGVAAILAGISFFGYHHAARTGFFTAAFGPLEAALFYGTVVFIAALNGARGLLGRRNPVRPLEVASGLWWAASCLWLAIVFPFDFARLGDPLGPASILLSWIPNDFARILLGAGVLIGIVTALDTTRLYLAVRRELRSSGIPGTPQAEAPSGADP